MTKLLSLAQALIRVTDFFGKIGAWLILPMMAVILFDVIMRHWFNVGSTMLQELEWHLHGALFLLAMAWAYNKNSHVRIELLSEKLNNNVRLYIEVIGIIIFLIPYVLVFIHFGYDYFSLSLANNEVSASQTGLAARYIIKGIMVFGFLLLGLSGVARLLSIIPALAGKHPHPQTIVSNEEPL